MGDQFDRHFLDGELIELERSLNRRREELFSTFTWIIRIDHLWLQFFEENGFRKDFRRINLHWLNFRA